MKHDAFSYRFTGKELIYKFFKKKICPICGCNLVETKTFQTKLGCEMNTKYHNSFIPDATVKVYEYNYHCSNCNIQYSLNELSKNKRRR